MSSVDLDAIVAAVVNGETISLGDVLRHARRNGGLGIVKDTVRAALIRQAIAREGVAPSDEQVDDLVACFRADKGLVAEEAFAEWLASNDLTLEKLRSEMRYGMAFGLLKGAVTEDSDTLLSRSSALRGKFAPPARGAMKIILFAHWLESEEAAARIEYRLGEAL